MIWVIAAMLSATSEIINVELWSLNVEALNPVSGLGFSTVE